MEGNRLKDKNVSKNVFKKKKKSTKQKRHILSRCISLLLEIGMSWHCLYIYLDSLW